MEMFVKLSEEEKDDIANRTAQILFAIINEKMMPINKPTDLITVKSIADEYKLSTQTLFDRIRDRHIPTQRLGKLKAVEYQYKDELLKKSA